jgi:hypothetical protein
VVVKSINQEPQYTGRGSNGITGLIYQWQLFFLNEIDGLKLTQKIRIVIDIYEDET